MVVDWIIRQSIAGQKTEIQWTFTKHLEDVDFTDDISLFFNRQQHTLVKLSRVVTEAEKTGLRINIGKTDVLRINNQQQDPVRLHQEDIEEMKKFAYLVSRVSKDGGPLDDIKRHINKARHAFQTLKPVWQSSPLSFENKLRIFNTNVKSDRRRGKLPRPTGRSYKRLPTDVPLHLHHQMAGGDIK